MLGNRVNCLYEWSIQVSNQLGSVAVIDTKLIITHEINFYTLAIRSGALHSYRLMG